MLMLSAMCRILAIAWSWLCHSAREPSGRPQHARRSDSRRDDRATSNARKAFKFCFDVATEKNNVGNSETENYRVFLQ